MVSCCLPGFPQDMPAVSTGNSGDRRRRIGPTIPAVRLKPHQRGAGPIPIFDARRDIAEESIISSIPLDQLDHAADCGAGIDLGEPSVAEPPADHDCVALIDITRQSSVIINTTSKRKR